MGLGHMRRNLLIAQTLACSSLPADILLIRGGVEAIGGELPPGVDCLTLPALYKESDGQYRARRLTLALQELIGLRAQTILAALSAFAPDLLIVDNVPRGALGELDPTLKELRARGHTRCVLGLRDVLDDPEVVGREWNRAANEAAIHDYYAAIWVYGDPAVYDPVREYRWPSAIAAKVRYTGYLDQRMRLAFLDSQGGDAYTLPELPEGQVVLCLVGGGQDGAHLAETFARADLPQQMNGVILTGPFMPHEEQHRLQRMAALQPRLSVLTFTPEPTVLLSHADRVVAMGGYNTVSELLSFEKRALIVPRVKPRREQLIRAERMSAMGLLDLLYPHALNPHVLSRWIAGETAPPRVHDRIDMNGLARLPGLLKEVLTASPGSAHDWPRARS
jgi:predicted glycosyltransferase